MNRQRTYDLVRDHLTHQNAKSVGPDDYMGKEEGCLFRGPNGLRCAIGALIPDELITPELNSRSVMRLPPSILEFIGVNNHSDRGFLAELQYIHDSWNPECWPQALYEFAMGYGLRP